METPFNQKAFRESAQKAAASAEAENEKHGEALDKKELEYATESILTLLKGTNFAKHAAVCGAFPQTSGSRQIGTWHSLVRNSPTQKSSFVLNNDTSLFQLVLLRQHTKDSLSFSGNLTPGQDIIDVEENNTKKILAIRPFSESPMDRGITHLSETLALQELADLAGPS